MVVLGAGQDVGRSCILVSFCRKKILFDCGMHLGFSDARRFPNFRYISDAGRFTEEVHCVVISHFHLDHCGALPHFTERCGYDGPVVMTEPTRAMLPILLKDYQHIMADRKGIADFYTADDVDRCMAKVKTARLCVPLHVDDELTLTAYYAGHVLGAAMFCAEVGPTRVFYTGDFTMTADRHLGAARIPEGLHPQLVISESTYGSTVGDTKPARERELLELVLSTLREGGKVLIPVFALGRAQELMVLLEATWERLGLAYPIFCSPGMAKKGQLYYQLYARWGSEGVRAQIDGSKETAEGRERPSFQGNIFSFPRIQPLDLSSAAQLGPCVLLATSGMLDGGLSLQAFKLWAGDARNLVILPGYCVSGSVGHSLLAGARHISTGPDSARIEVKCRVARAAFAAHADCKGIFAMLRALQPQSALLVHGDKCTVQALRARVTSELGIPCHCPANGTRVTIATPCEWRVTVAADMASMLTAAASVGHDSRATSTTAKKRQADGVEGVLVVRRRTRAAADMDLMTPELAAEQLGLHEHQLSVGVALCLPALRRGDAASSLLAALMEYLHRVLPRGSPSFVLLGNPPALQASSVHVCRREDLLDITWKYADEPFAKAVVESCEDWVKIQ